jgi:glutamyl-tRNA synthetase
MTVITRLAPSPTGDLHIGTARTALFNWLFARHHGGKFLLRIEDTDRARSTEAAVETIIKGLKWLGLDWDGEPVSQFSRAKRHAEAALSLLETGGAYYCYATPEELETMRAEQKAQGLPQRYDGRWRDRDPREAPPGVKPVLRLKQPQSGETTLVDLVRGETTIANAQLDDMVLLRGDGTPTFMLAVVVDDHDYGITHVIRGDDHFTNTFRQIQLYNALGWKQPAFGHIPLIHGADGAKLSKRHGALGVDAYREMGYLPEAMRNYLLRLGWAHGDDEIISTAQAIEWFETDGIGKSPSRLDFSKLDNTNAHYMREADDRRLLDLVRPQLETAVGRALTAEDSARLLQAMPSLKSRAKTVVELARNAHFLIERVEPEAKALSVLQENERIIGDLMDRLSNLASFSTEDVEGAARALAEEKGLKLGVVAQPLRAALSGSTISPPIFEAASILGKDETLARLKGSLSLAAAH